jgi:Flp pilus assembly protein TadG
VSVFVAGIAVALILLIGLVVDGGGRLRAAQRADTLAAEAARSAAQEIDAGRVVADGTVSVSPDAATAAVASYLSAAGASGTATVSPDGRTISVTVTMPYRPLFSGTVGVHTTVTGTARATLVRPGVQS